MRWEIRKQHAAQCVQEDEGERGSKSKRRAFSFSLISWLAKLTAKEKPGAPAKHAPAFPPKNSAAAHAFPTCLRKRTSPSPVVVTPGRPSPPRRSPADVVPRRLSVGNDSAEAVAARRHCQHRCRHSSLGGDHELPPLGYLIPFSLAGSAARPPRTAASAAPDTDDGPARVRRYRRRRSRRLSVSGRRSSFSGRMPLRVRVRSPRRAAVAPELERLAVVRRTRDPQRAFRESMVEMIASSGSAPRPEELERLLACYLSLNADEHHDCIVKVFRQIWLEYGNLLDRSDAGRRPPARR
ncbi:transcription repressor OFP1-like [Phragmites australis]|uniref:transcription repressor OFP1-like n=1 Tax=Phragmites australis TaxID=29695 RepID=UPI002D785080|nr:transcription repressor OFP1-like [Phragmites australis]